MVVRTRQHGTDSQLIERFLLLVCSKYIHFSLFFFWTQTRPAIELGSSEEGLRPLRVCLRGRPELREGPWLLLWSRGKMSGQGCCLTRFHL